MGEIVLLGLSIADWIVLAIYFVVIVSIGVWSATKVKNMADYFMGGRRFGKVFMMFFAFGAGTNADQAVGVVAGTWRVGLAGIWWQFLWLWATPFYWIVAPVMRRMRALTTADFFESRFSTSTATLYSVYGIMTSIVFMAGGLYGAGKMVDALTGSELDRVAIEADIQVPDLKWNPEDREIVSGTRRIQGYEFAILAMTVLFVAYGMAGGLGAAIITDFIQGVLTIAFSFLLLPFVFEMIGGFGQLHEQADLKTGMLEMVADPKVATALGREPITGFYVLMLSLTALAGIVVQPHIMGVCGAGKTELEGRFGFTFGNFLKRFCTMAWTFTGLACIIWYLGSESNLPEWERRVYDAGEQTTTETTVTTTTVDATTTTIATTTTQKAAKFSLQTVNAGLLSPGEDDADTELKAAFIKRFDKSVDGTPVDGKLDEGERSDADKAFADGLFGRAAYDILPTIMPGLVGLLLASLLAAVMSSADAQMVVSSGLFTENIYKRFMARDKSQRHYLWVGRITGLLIVLCALVLQSTFTDVIHALKVIINTPAALGISLWFGIVWRGWTPSAVWVSTLLALGSWAAMANHGPLLAVLNLPALTDWNLPEWLLNAQGNNLTSAWVMAIYMFVGVSSGMLVSFFTPRPTQEKLDHFFTLIHTPITPGEEVAAPCTLPDNPAPKGEKLFNLEDIELPKPTLIGLGGFVIAWMLVALIIWLTSYLAEIW
ncbi:MAG: hypothetical protein O3A00_22265 [Planctomycetota bacterium]|nr:hypothetical protein [Planctomycetota bacterium]